MSDPSQESPHFSVPTIDPTSAGDIPHSQGRPDPDRYELGDEIARGGMGVVVRARDRNLNRELAVKLVHSHLSDRPAVLRRFREEAEILGWLQHPGIVPVHEVGTLSDGRPFFAMKLVVGRTLAELLKERPLSNLQLGRFLPVFELVCQTVAYAHSRGFVHRDLKPANIMVGEFGEVQVMDWGLARRMRDEGRTEPGVTQGGESADDPDTTVDHAAEPSTDEDFTTPGQVVGTPAFMPPEQARGECDRVGQAADVFALGGILCELLTGRPPYMGPVEEILAEARAGRVEAAWARVRAANADAELIDLGVRCLQPEPGARPRDAGELAGLVASYRAGVEERVRAADRQRAEALAEAREQRKRRKVQMALAGVMGLLLAGGGAFAWWADRQGIDKRDRMARNAERIEELLARCESGLRGGDADVAGPPLAEVEKRLSEGGTEGFAARVERCRVDLAMLQELNSIDDFRWTPVEGKFPEGPAVAARWQAAFAGFGIEPGTTTPAQATGLLAASLIRERLVGALDLWLVAGGPAGLAKVLAAADPDAYRDAMRAAVVAGNSWLVQILAAPGAALGQPARFAVALGRHRAIPAERRRALLQQPVVVRPDDLSVLMGLGSTYPVDQAEGAAERLRWFQAAVAAHPGNAGAHNNLGIALGDSGEWDKAIAEFQRATEIEPKYAPAHHNLGRALREKGRLDEAIAAYKQAITLDPKSAPAHSYLGFALRAKGQLDDAIAAWKLAISIDPNDAPTHSNLGIALAAKGQLDEAIVAYKQAITLNPKSAPTHNNLGAALVAKGQLDEAIAAYKQAIGIDPKDAPAHYNLGSALRDKGQLDEAIVAYKQAITLNPKHALANNNLGNALRAKGQLDVAIAVYKQAITLDPKYAPAHYNLGLALRAKGQLDDAIAAYKQAISIDPRYVSAHYNLGIALHEKGQLDEAIAAYKQAINLNPNYALAHSSLGLALVAKGQLDDAIAAYKQAIGLDPKSAPTHSNMGLALRAKGQLDDAIAAFEQAIKLNPKLAQAHVSLGAIYVHQKKYPEAIACARAAITADPKFSNGHAMLGDLLLRAGDIPGARAALTEAVRVDRRWEKMLAKLPPLEVAPPPRGRKGP